jgi:hypothetical protein
MDGFNVVSIPRSSSTELTEDYSDNESAILFWLIIFVVAVILVSSISLGFYVAVKYINLRTRKRYENQRVSALGNTSNTTSLTNTDRKPPTMGRKRKVAPVKMTLPTVLFKKEKANQDGNISIITDRALTNGVSRNL